jgi:hypothetical protein
MLPPAKSSRSRGIVHGSTISAMRAVVVQLISCVMMVFGRVHARRRRLMSW